MTNHFLVGKGEDGVSSAEKIGKAEDLRSFRDQRSEAPSDILLVCTTTELEELATNSSSRGRRKIGVETLSHKELGETPNLKMKTAKTGGRKETLLCHRYSSSGAQKREGLCERETDTLRRKQSQ